MSTAGPCIGRPARDCCSSIRTSISGTEGRVVAPISISLCYQTDAAKAAVLKETRDCGVKHLHSDVGGCAILIFMGDGILLPCRQPSGDKGFRILAEVRGSDLNETSLAQVHYKLVDRCHGVADEYVAHVSKIFGGEMAPACTGPQCSIRHQGAALASILYRAVTGPERDASRANRPRHQMWLPVVRNRGHHHTGVLRARRGHNVG